MKAKFFSTSRITKLLFLAGVALSTMNAQAMNTEDEGARGGATSHQIANFPAFRETRVCGSFKNDQKSEFPVLNAFLGWRKLEFPVLNVFLGWKK